MNINHIGNTIVSTPNCDLKLDNFLHVPSAKKNLVSVHRLAADNHAFLEFHPVFFLIKDQATRRTFWKASVEEAFILFPSQDVKLIVLPHPLRRDGIVDWVTLLVPLSIETLVRIICLVLRKLV
jgi:hypothetical protein